MSEVKGVVRTGHYGEVRLHISPEESGTAFIHDAALDAVLSIALRKGGFVKLEDGDEVIVSVRVVRR